MNKILATIALLPCVALGQSAAPSPAAIDRIMRSQVDSGFSGVVLLASKDSILFYRAYGRPGRSVKRADPFWIASMTKGFTAAAVLRLQQEGKLRLTDPITTILEDVPADKSNITIQQLLTHTSGLGGEYTGGAIATRSKAVTALLAQPLIYIPGKGYKYADDNYELLAAIIEIASGEAWEDYVRSRILVPAGITHIGFACRAPRGGRRPLRSALKPEANASTSRVPCDWGHKGANGMYASADDLLKWDRALMRAGKLGAAGNGVLARPQILVRTEPPFDVSYGYGVRIYTLNGKVIEVMHSGSGDNDHTGIMRHMSSGITVIVLSNAGQHAGTTWSSYVARQIVSRQ